MWGSRLGEAAEVVDASAVIDLLRVRVEEDDFLPVCSRKGQPEEPAQEGKSAAHQLGRLGRSTMRRDSSRPP